MDIVSAIIEYESGELSDKQTLELFAELIKTGMAWQLQGSYGRTARDLILNGFINTKGEILKENGME